MSVREEDSRGGEDVPPSARIVTIGDELLSGERLDGNAHWLARHLTGLGFRVLGIESVGDEGSDIGSVLRRAASDAEFVVVTGGLGPTLDDRTREAVAQAWGLPLEESPEILRELIGRFRERGYHELPAGNRRIALIPKGARPVANPRGSAPGLWLGPQGSPGPCFLLLLPGVPHEMTAIMEGPARDLLTRTFGSRLRPAQFRLIRTTGVPESVLAGRIEALMGSGSEVEVAYRPSLRGVELRLSARGAEAGAKLDEAEETLLPVLAAHRYEAPSGDLAEAVGRGLSAAGLRVAVAESCTGGALLRRLTDVPGSSAWVVGGVVAYADRIKTEWLAVSPAVLSAQGAVSEGVARGMASGVRRRMGVEVGVGITGIAGPSGGSDAKPVGTVWFAVDGLGESRAERVRFPGDREEVRERATQHALHLLLKAVVPSPASTHVRANPDGLTG
jgi:nicotinamide-nucleotide amidase